ncbi:hypothetical protein CEUSTIGMA_g6215.t1 [Chlamydomonas eustigma]|uniref:Uncharacterized protein n=1 Tax=Chlamydomonas eustigma TaxID=1157962 RepID=A0A250X6S2_9CHLO|nr:hypothetical protein CEUSTIGMA_g6215.t1 [Chlamydomonas eustigma]|eukprot:GAX78778.1 hypothetical protein CEUSTIGMA_g6215.t1 [Chlamydomonas eustigma]
MFSPGDKVSQQCDFKDLYWYRLPLVAALFGYYVYASLAPMSSIMLNGLLFILYLNTLNMCFQVLRMIYATYKIVCAARRKNIMNLLSKSHAFIIPNYKEPLHVLQNTLHRLASHTHASSYTIILAMESKEADHEAKAEILIQEFNLQFKEMTFTSHTLASHEMAGKASNVNHAVREVSSWLDPAIMLTVLDADAEVCERYISELDPISNERDIFAAPIMFEQNTSSTPMLVCVNDYIWAAMAIQNMNPMSMTMIGFPMSAYSLSLALAKRVGFWDTHPDAIGEDMHMFIKAYIKTKGECQIQFVPAPINMGHVEGDGYVGTIWARIMQAERHMRGIADSAYTLKFMWKVGFHRGIQLYLQLLEAHLLPFLVINTMVFFPIYYMNFHQLTIKSKEILIIEMVGKCTLTLAVIVLLCYEIIRNTACKYMYSHKTPAFRWYYFPCYLLLLIAATPFMILPTVYVAFKHLFNVNATNYYVAVKGGSTFSKQGLAGQA